MPEKQKKNTGKTPEKLLQKRQKPRRIRIVTLRVQELLILYSYPWTVRELQKKLAIDGHTPITRKLLSAGILKDLTVLPPPGYEMTVKMTRAGSNKAVKAYQLKKIKWQKTTHSTPSPSC